MSSPTVPVGNRTAWLTSLAAGLIVAGCSAAGTPRTPSPERIASLEAAFRSSPGSVDARLHLAAARDATGRPADAVELLGPLATGPDPDPAAVFLLATSFEKLEQYAEARRTFESYLALRGPLPLRGAAESRIELLARRELESAVRDAIAREASLQTTTPGDDAIGVFPYFYAGDDPGLDPLSRAIAELLSTDLAQTDRLVVVERARLQYLLDELDLTASGAVDPASGVRAGRMVGAGRIVQGTITGGADALRIETAVVRVSDDGVGSTVTEDGEIARLFEMEKQIALSIYASAGVQLTVAERERVLRRHTDNVQALLAFGFGLAADDESRYDEAIASFERALSLDGGFELARIWLERSRKKRNAEQLDGNGLIRLGELELGWWLPDWQRRRLLFAAVDPMIPDPDVRDGGPEVLGVEGLDRRAIVDVIIRPPGGGQ